MTLSLREFHPRCVGIDEERRNCMLPVRRHIHFHSPFSIKIIEQHERGNINGRKTAEITGASRFVLPP